MTKAESSINWDDAFARIERAALESKRKELEELAKILEDERNRQRQGSVEPAGGSSKDAISFVLGLGLLRGSVESNTLAIPEGTRAVRIIMNFSAGDRSNYNVILKTVDGAEALSGLSL